MALTAATATSAAFAGGTGYGGRQDATLKFSEGAPGSSSGSRLRIDYANPDDPDAKPPVVRRVVLRLAKGGHFDTSAPGQCEASDAELMAVGASACPARSRIGTGVITVDTGFPGPGRFVTADVIFLNNENELIFLNTVRGSGARTVVRSEVRRRRIVSEVPMLPGTPPDGGAIDTVRAVDRAISREGYGERRNYITTPSLCPQRGYWVNTVRFVYRDGVTQTVNSRSSCEA